MCKQKLRMQINERTASLKALGKQAMMQCLHVTEKREAIECYQKQHIALSTQHKLDKAEVLHDHVTKQAVCAACTLSRDHRAMTTLQLRCATEHALHMHEHLCTAA